MFLFLCRNESKKLGLFVEDVDSESESGVPTKIPRKVTLNKKAVDIASGCHHFLMLTDDGQVYSLGEGSKGQLGRISPNELHSIKSNRELFLQAKVVKFPTPVSIVKIFASQWCSYALTTDGDLYAWGLNNYYQLGFRTLNPITVASEENPDIMVTMSIELFPVRVPFEKKVAAVSNGQQHFLLLDTEGQVHTCGSALYGKLGLGKEFVDNCKDLYVDSLQQIDLKSFQSESIISVECGDFCSMAISKSGKLFTWGQGSPHIGTNSERDLFEPTVIGGPYAADARFISASSGAQYAALVGVLAAH